MELQIIATALVIEVIANWAWITAILYLFMFTVKLWISAGGASGDDPTLRTRRWMSEKPYALGYTVLQL